MNTNKIIAATFILASTFSVGAMAQEQCGLSNGVTATGEAIQIGSIVGKTGPEDFSSSARAANAYFSCVNANGGINGRPIAYTIQDDTWNPEVASQAASKLVKDVQVVGMVGSSSFVECGANAKLYELVPECLVLVSIVKTMPHLTKARDHQQWVPLSIW
jgi:branched-chain amino acid transport system substrate-binding protein